MEPVRFLESIIGLMQDAEIAVIANALDVPATTAAEILNKICPVPNLVIRAVLDVNDLLVYWKQHEENYASAILTMCGAPEVEASPSSSEPKNAE